jgi:D-3-phosphoglycerate dehydrogenase
MELAPLLVLFRYDDVPGVIGKVGTLFGDAGVNIANMVVGRQKAGDAMMMALSIDGTIPQEIVDELLATPNVLAARFIDLS